MSVQPHSLKQVSPIPRKLLAWYDRHGRTLPWRYRPGEMADPYRVWLSEIMLQQTTVAAVKAYFERFTTTWPTVADLSAAPIDDIMTAWAGLGYYSRARNLHAAAIHVVANHGGVFPSTEDELRGLPGVGPYTAAAIAAIGFGRKATPVDGNIERVMARLFSVETTLPAAKPRLKELAVSVTPDERAGDFAQALMDLGATICTPRSPVCSLCPLNEDCTAYASGIAAELPRKSPKAARTARFGYAFVMVSAEGNIFVRRRPPEGLLGGTLEVPTTPWRLEKDAASLDEAPLQADWRLAGTVEHGFTHLDLTLDVYRADLLGEAALPGDWSPAATIETAGLSTLMRKVVAAALAGDQARPRLGRGRRRG